MEPPESPNRFYRFAHLIIAACSIIALSWGGANENTIRCVLATVFISSWLLLFDTEKVINIIMSTTIIMLLADSMIRISEFSIVSRILLLLACVIFLYKYIICVERRE